MIEKEGVRAFEVLELFEHCVTLSEFKDTNKPIELYTCMLIAGQEKILLYPHSGK